MRHPPGRQGPRRQVQGAPVDMCRELVPDRSEVASPGQKPFLRRRALKVHRIVLSSVFSAILFASGVVVGQETVDPRVHPHLAEAQKMIAGAIGQIDTAQAAWKDKLGGHAQRAKELLQQADGELKQAAEYANKYK